MRWRLGSIGILLLIGVICWPPAAAERIPEGREEVVFWHFWGGEDLPVVRDVVQRFNAAQSKYWVREIAMPGNNLQAKLFLSIAGGSPPDLVNQDDPILGDWTESRLILPLDEVAPAEEVRGVQEWMFPGAQRLSLYQGRMMGVCNGLDVRALYYNQSWLESLGFAPPQSIEEFNRIIEAVSPFGSDRSRERYAFLPDSRRLWAWAIAFGGRFLDDSTGQLTLADPGNVAALRWMQSFTRHYGSDNLAAFRRADHSLPGKSFPLLPVDDEATQGRYLFVMDGQWRVRDLERFTARRREMGLKEVTFGVCPLPPAEGGPQNAGWINGNFFVVPRGARQPEGAWAFIKFWIGKQDPSSAAKTCAAGGWIPVSPDVVDEPLFQQFLNERPLFNEFMKLANSPNQVPIPIVPGSDRLRRDLNRTVFDAMANPDSDPVTWLSDLAQIYGNRKPPTREEEP